MNRRGIAAGVAFVATPVALYVAVVYGPRLVFGRRAVSVVAAADPSSVLPRAPAAAPDDPPMDVDTRSLLVGGNHRRYVVASPKGATATLPLVLVLHGDGWNAPRFREAFTFERASGAGAVVAYLEGDYLSGEGAWVLGGADPNPDFAYVDAVLDDLASKIERSRVYAIGYSSGGFFANLLACRRPDVVRAFASSEAGSPYQQAEAYPNGFAKCAGEAPVPALVIHGDLDFAVTLDSGRFSAEYWAYVDGCDEHAVETTGYPECTAYRGCRKPVVYCQVPGLTHWLWDHASEAAWGFFQKN